MGCSSTIQTLCPITPASFLAPAFRRFQYGTVLKQQKAGQGLSWNEATMTQVVGLITAMERLTGYYSQFSSSTYVQVYY